MKKIRMTKTGAQEALDVMAQAVKWQRAKIRLLQKQVEKWRNKAAFAMSRSNELERQKDQLALDVLSAERRFQWRRPDDIADIPPDALCVLAFSGNKAVWLSVHRNGEFFNWPAEWRLSDPWERCLPLLDDDGKFLTVLPNHYSGAGRVPAKP